MMHKTLQIETSPHLVAGHRTDTIMANVVLALLPVCAFSVYAFGLGALITLTVALAACLLTEHLLCKYNHKPTTIGDWSTAITAILYALTLPPGLPLWMVVLGAVIAVSLGKYLFGGLGFNAFNPALVGRAFLQAAFPTSMTTWGTAFASDRFVSVPETLFTGPFQMPDYQAAVDGITSATPLALMKFEQKLTDNTDLFAGFTAGSYGETCAWAILAGGVYLAARNMLNWRIPVTIFFVCALISFISRQVNPDLYPGPMFTLFAGGLMLGAVFMATDMVASPMTTRGVIIYGALIGVLIMVIRNWGGLPEGVMYAILIANALSPHIDAHTQPVVYGAREKESS